MPFISNTTYRAGLHMMRSSRDRALQTLLSTATHNNTMNVVDLSTWRRNALTRTLSALTMKS